jgi:beta-glucosidase
METRADYPYRNALLPIQDRLNDLLSRMTLEEKIAQLSIFRKSTNILEAGDVILDQSTRNELSHGIGGLGRPGQFATAKETAIVINNFQKCLLENTRLGIPAFFIDEALHGLMAYGSTSFPQAIALGQHMGSRAGSESFRSCCV